MHYFIKKCTQNNRNALEQKITLLREGNFKTITVAWKD